MHYVGEVHNPNSPLRRVFDVIADGKLKWAKMDAVYDKIIIQDTQYNFVAGAANFRDELLKSLPNGRKQIDDYLKHIFAPLPTVCPRTWASATCPHACNLLPPSWAATTLAALPRL